MKLRNGIKDQDDRSNGKGILMTDTFAKINPTESLKFSSGSTMKKTKLI
jgi:hypothetical protein